MTGTTYLKSALMSQNKEALEQILLNTNDLNLRLASLYGLSKNITSVNDFSPYREAIIETIDCFVQQLSECLGKGRILNIENFIEESLKISLNKQTEEKVQTIETWNRPIDKLPTIVEVSESPYLQIPMYSVSALKVYGYTVGVTAGWPQKKRRKFLSEFMQAKLPEQITRIYGDHYGEPSSLERLKAVANLLAHNIISRKRANNPSLAHAISDWNEDLQFLFEEYYWDWLQDYWEWPNIDV